MNWQTRKEARDRAIAIASEGGRLAVGDTRKPKFGEKIRGIWAGDDNPIRDGMYVETIRRTGRVNRGIWYRLTNGKGKFWEFEAKDTVFLTIERREDDGVICRVCGGKDHFPEHCPSWESDFFIPHGREGESHDNSD
jgi:hypothetical protein